MSDPGGAYDWSLGFGEYLAGLLFLVLTVGSAALVARALRRRLLPGWEGAPGFLASSVLTVGVLLGAAELVGLVGLFDRIAYTVVLIACAAAAIGLTNGWGRSARGDREAGAAPVGVIAGPGVVPQSGGSAATVVSLTIAALVLIRALGAAAGAFDGGMSGFDTHWYHGPFTALFLQSGDTFALNNSIAPQYLSWFYPHNSELAHAIAALGFGRDWLSPALNLFWMAGAMLAAWCIGRPFGVAPLSLIGACVVLASGLLADQAGEMRNDMPAVFFVLAAAAIAVNARVAEGSPGVGALVVVGLAAGLAAGTKLNYLATAGALILALAFTLPAGRRLRGFGVLAFAAVAGGGWWYLRNLVHAGNPLPWIKSIGPIDLPAPSQEIGGREPHGVVEYLLDAEVWRDWFLPGLREALTLAWPLILAAAILATLVLLLGRPRPAGEGGDERSGGAGYAAMPRPLAIAIALTILATAAAWLVAPASAEGPLGKPVGFVSGLRYLAPALALALALLPITFAPWLTRLATGGGRGRARDRVVDEGRVADAGPADPVSSRSPLGSTAGRALTALALLAVAAGGFALQRHYLESRYAEPDFSTPGLNRAFADASRAAPTPEGAPSLAVGSTRIYPFFGPDLRRPVVYVGIPEPHGGFRRPATCAEWRRAVNATGAERLILALDRIEPGGPRVPSEAGWIDADPGARRVSLGGGVAIFEIERRLNPAACP